VVLLAGGRVIADGPPDALGQQEETLVEFQLPAGLEHEELPVAAERHGRTLFMRTSTPTRDLAPLLSWAAVRGFELEQLTVSRPTLEDVYLQLTEEAA
jgi:ABC-2 type transport system ATP-binding protein